MIDRRETVNQHGAKVPTETEAVRRIEFEDKALADARKLYGIFVRACCLAGFHLNAVEIQRSGYKFTEKDLQKGAKS